MHVRAPPTTAPLLVDPSALQTERPVLLEIIGKCQDGSNSLGTVVVSSADLQIHGHGFNSFAHIAKCSVVSAEKSTEQAADKSNH